MFCMNCGHKIEKGSVFCSNCGIRLKNGNIFIIFINNILNFIKNFSKKTLVIFLLLIVVLSFIFFIFPIKNKGKEQFTNLLNYSEEKAISILTSMGYNFEIFPEEISSQSMMDSWFEIFDTNIPNSSEFIRFYNSNNSIHTILLVINDDKVIAWYGQFDDNNGQYLDNLLNILDIKLKNPSEHYWLGTDLHGNYYSLDDSYVRIVQNEKNYRAQFGVIRHDKKDWVNQFLYENKELYSEVDLTTQCPFFKEEFDNLYKRNNWYDNGVFSSYIDTDYPNYDWEYIGTTSDNLFPNPYSYNGYDIYKINKKDETFLFVVPYSEFISAPLVYSYDSNKHTITLVFNNGEIIK